MVNPPPVTVSTKSTSAPLRYRMLMGSTNSVTPFDWNTWSPTPPASSIISPYWKPEQPPPCTNTRRPLPTLPSSVSSSLIFSAALGDTLIIARSWSEPCDWPYCLDYIRPYQSGVLRKLFPDPGARNPEPYECSAP